MKDGTKVKLVDKTKGVYYCSKCKEKFYQSIREKDPLWYRILYKIFGNALFESDEDNKK
jgi:hypothetical protein